jgi:deoxycytidine triphosphate deaminase
MEVPSRSQQEQSHSLAIAAAAQPHRVLSKPDPTPMLDKTQMQTRPKSVMVQPGTYLLEFSEMVENPLSSVGQIFVRDSLFRSEAPLSAGLMDSG